MGLGIEGLRVLSFRIKSLRPRDFRVVVDFRVKPLNPEQA